METLPFETLLQESGWPAPVAVRHIFKIYHKETILRESWMNYSIPAPLFVVSWDEADIGQKESIRAREPALREDPEYLSPFLDDDVDSLTSVALKYGEEIVGWMINTRLPRDSVLFRHWYILPRFRKPRASLVLLAESIRRFVATGRRLAIYTAVLKRAKLYRLYKNLMGHLLDEVKVEFHAAKELSLDHEDS